MRVLITSGGTKVPIDRVRDITNMSHGTFGARIAHEALELGHEVYFFCAQGSCTPFSHNFDLYRQDDWETAINGIANLYNFCQKHRDHYVQITFRNFEDYQRKLQSALDDFAPDVVILAAAVSDYGVANYVDGKIRSGDNQQILLTPYPKVISQIKGWCPGCILVGFKLLTEATDDELVAAARKSIAKNGCDLVVANDLQSLKKNNHRLILVWPEGESYDCEQYEKAEDPLDPYYLARVVAKAATEAVSCKISC